MWFKLWYYRQYLEYNLWSLKMWPHLSWGDMTAAHANIPTEFWQYHKDRKWHLPVITWSPLSSQMQKVLFLLHNVFFLCFYYSSFLMEYHCYAYTLCLSDVCSVFHCIFGNNTFCDMSCFLKCWVVCFVFVIFCEILCFASRGHPSCQYKNIEGDVLMNLRQYPHGQTPRPTNTLTACDL